MEKQSIKQIGKKLRECIPLRADLPQPIVKALQKLSEAESKLPCTSTINANES